MHDIEYLIMKPAKKGTLPNCHHPLPHPPPLPARMNINSMYVCLSCVVICHFYISTTVLVKSAVCTRLYSYIVHTYCTLLK